MTYSTSLSVKRVFTGTATRARIWMPQNASAQSLPLPQPDGDAVAPPTPSARRPPATLAARSQNSR